LSDRRKTRFLLNFLGLFLVAFSVLALWRLQVASAFPTIRLEKVEKAGFFSLPLT